MESSQSEKNNRPIRSEPPWVPPMLRASKGCFTVQEGGTGQGMQILPWYFFRQKKHAKLADFLHGLQISSWDKTILPKNCICHTCIYFRHWNMPFLLSKKIYQKKMRQKTCKPWGTFSSSSPKFTEDHLQPFMFCGKSMLHEVVPGATPWRVNLGHDVPDFYLNRKKHRWMMTHSLSRPGPWKKAVWTAYFP